MKKFILTVILALSSLLTYSQTFRVIDDVKLSDEELSKYVTAIEKADMNSYRNRTKRQILTFDNGLKVELYSAKELIIKGINLDINDYQDTRDPKFTFPTFHLAENGYLVALYKKIEK